MVSLLSWYLLSTFLGWLVFPIFFRLLPALTDRGYTLIRAGSLLFWGYAFWLLATLGILQSYPGGVLFAVGLVGGLSLFALKNGI